MEAYNRVRGAVSGKIAAQVSNYDASLRPKLTSICFYDLSRQDTLTYHRWQGGRPVSICEATLT